MADGVQLTHAQKRALFLGWLGNARAKLGRSFHTRRLSPGSRARRLRSLTPPERWAAAQVGWVPR